MKALVASPGAEGKVDLVDVDEPEARPNQVLVEVMAASLNRGEVRALHGAEPGWRPGWDVAGVVGTRPPDGEEFVLVLESVGGASLAAALARVAAEGTVVSFGNSSDEPTTFDPTAFYRKPGARLYAFVVGHELQRSQGTTTDL